MSVTLYIENNRQYVDENCPEQIEEIVYDTPGYDLFIDRRYPFEMNLANGNFFALWSALDLEADYCGEIHPNLVLGALKRKASRAASELVREASASREDGKCLMIDCGRSEGQVSRYFFRLREIASEALRRGEMLYWA